MTTITMEEYIEDSQYYTDLAAKGEKIEVKIDEQKSLYLVAGESTEFRIKKERCTHKYDDNTSAIVQSEHNKSIFKCALCEQRFIAKQHNGYFTIKPVIKD